MFSKGEGVGKVLRQVLEQLTKQTVMEMEQPHSVTRKVSVQ